MPKKRIDLVGIRRGMSVGIRDLSRRSIVAQERGIMEVVLYE